MNNEKELEETVVGNSDEVTENEQQVEKEQSTQIESESVEQNEVETQEVLPEPSPDPKTKSEILNELINIRMGNFDISSTYQTLKYIKNVISQKVSWKGSNEAYLVIISTLNLDSVLADLDPKSSTPTKVSLSSATVESVNYFLNKMDGTGLDSAQKLFGAVMTLRPVLEELKRLDEKIKVLQSEVESEKK
jgi:hypothetical protein